MKLKTFVCTFLFWPGLCVAATNVETLKHLVDISSGSNDPQGVNQVQQFLSEQLKNLGFSTDLTPYPTNKLGSLLVGTRKGQSAKFVTLIVHADTVFEKDSKFSKFQISDDAKTATGPGAIDDKGGIVVLISALNQYLKDNPNPKYSLRVVSSPAEEVGTPEFVPNYKIFSADSVLVLGLEPCIDDGSIVDSRRGNRWYDIKVIGREAHAGRAHKEGINACLELAKKLEAISELTDYKKDLTVSIGHIEGGKDKYNIVCGEASAKIDVRFSSIEVRDAAHDKIVKIVQNSSVRAASDKKSASAELHIADDTPPFASTKESQKYSALLIELAQKYEGQKVSVQKSGGTADSNFFSREGLPILDGLGACGGKMHTENEFILLSSLETRAQILAEFLSKF